jgi:hypothetical protein
LITKKANATCAFLRRNKNSCSRQVKTQCFTTLVRPDLEYAATVWDPYTKCNIKKPEKCQRRAARFVNGDYSRESSVKGNKMANFITKKNQHINSNDVQDSPPPYIHTFANVPYSCNHQNNMYKRP